MRKWIAQVLQRNVWNIFCIQPLKRICTILVFLNCASGYKKFCNFFIFEMAWSRAVQNCVSYHLLDLSFLQTCLLYNRILKNKFQFLQICNFFLQILKEKHKSFPMMYHLFYLDIKHRILRGRVIKLTLPPLPTYSGI